MEKNPRRGKKRTGKLINLHSVLPHNRKIRPFTQNKGAVVRCVMFLFCRNFDFGLCANFFAHRTVWKPTTGCQLKGLALPSPDCKKSGEKGQGSTSHKNPKKMQPK